MLLDDDHPAVHDHSTKAAIRCSVEGFSIEALPRDAKRIGDFRDHLPEGTSVYVGWPPKTDLPALVRAARKLTQEGMIPVPHLAARRVTSHAQLRDFVRAMSEEANVSQLLLLGGDPNPPVGPYADATALLRAGVLQEFDIDSVGFAAHPEVHPAVPSETLTRVLQRKISSAQIDGLQVHAVSQFVLDPTSFTHWYSNTYRDVSLGANLRIGIPGKVSTKRLLQMASFCGLSDSINMLRKSGHRLAKAALHNGATGTLVSSLSSLIQGNGNVSGFHFYPFGNFEKTAEWACAVSRGQFDFRDGEIRVSPVGELR